MVNRLALSLFTATALFLLAPGEAAAAGDDAPHADDRGSKKDEPAPARGGKKAGQRGGKKKGGGGKKGGGKKGGGKKGGGKGKKGKKGKDGPKGVGPFPKGKYPIEEKMRPLVLPDAMGEAGLDVNIVSVAGTTAVGTTASFSYGVGDTIDFGVATGLLLSPDVDWSRSLTLQGHYLAVDTKDFDFAPGLVLPLSFADGAPIGVVLDLPGRYIASDMVFLTFGQGAIPIVFSPDFALSIAGNGGVGIQVQKELAILFDTSLFTLALAPDANVTGIWEFLNLGVGAQYSWDRNWDVGARLGITNIWDVPDTLGVGFTAYGRFRF